MIGHGKHSILTLLLVVSAAATTACTESGFSSGTKNRGGASAPTSTMPENDEDLGSGTTTEPDVDLGTDGQNDLETEDGEQDLVEVDLAVTRQLDTADWTNCLFVSVNGGKEISLGCNKGALAPRTKIKAKAKPFCNQVRLVLWSNGKRNRSTENLAHVARDFRISQAGASRFVVKCNDNGDDNWNDLNLTIDGQGEVDFTIENSGIGCE